LTTDPPDDQRIEARTHQVGNAVVAEPVVPLFQKMLAKTGASSRSTVAHAAKQKQQTAPNRLLFFGALWVLLSAVIIGILLFSRPLIDIIQTYQRTDQFVVVITPFADGTNGQTGHVVAQDLAQLLKQQAGDDMLIVTHNTRPSNEQHAQAIAADTTADVVVWGSVRPGEMLDSESLEPRITYTPRGSYGPNVWSGYAGRFMLPEQFVLSNAPINGKAVMPRFILALAHYHNGIPDTAYVEMDSLLTDHQALNVPLLWVLRGNIEWARGTYQQAITSYQYAKELSPNEYNTWLYANNLSAILFDAGNTPAANAELLLAIESFQNTKPAALAYNQGMLSLQRHAYAEGLNHFQQARRSQDTLTTIQAPLLLNIAECQRQLGQLEAAERTIEQVAVVDADDRNLIPPQLRPLYQGNIHAATLEQQGLLALAQAVNARGPLAWELEVASIGNKEQGDQALALLNKAVETQEQVFHEWNTHTTAEEVERHFTKDSTGNPAVLVADGQIARSTAALERQRYGLALAFMQQGYTSAEKTGVFQEISKLIGSQTPFDKAEALLAGIIAAPEVTVSSQTYPALIAHGHILQLRRDYEQANERYNIAQALAPQQPEGYFGHGMVQLAEGNRAAAREWFVQSLMKHDAFFPARIKLAEMAVQEGNWEAAIQQLRTVATHYPHQSTLLNLASVLRQSGPSGYAEAEQVLQPLIKQNNPEALMERGRIRRDAGQMAAAVSDFRQAYEQHTSPSSSGAAFEWGQTLLMNQDYRGAEAQFQAAIKEDTSNMLARLALVDLYLGPLNDPRAADQHYSTVLDAGIHDADVLVRLGEALLEHDQANRATVAFQQALRQRPDDAMIHHLLAQSHLQLDKPSAALKEEEHVLELTSNMAADTLMLRSDALVGMGEAELQRGNSDQAETHFNEALMLNGNNLGALIGLGRVATGRGNWAVAQGYFETAVNRGGQTDPMVLFWLAEAQLRQPDPRGAMATYQQTLELKPHFPAALLGLAQAQYALDSTNPAPALDTIQQALDQNGRYGEALLFKCKLLREQGQVDAAWQACDEAIAANSRLGEAYYHRGTIAMQRENYQQAVDDLRRAAILYPTADTFYWLGRAYFTDNTMVRAATAFAKAEAMQDGGYPEAQFYRALAEQRLGQYDIAIASLEDLVRSARNTEWVGRAQEELQRLRDLQSPVQFDVQISGNP
jgi:tetratricopeptide (TPR) repeat protein